jgi:hypothetical protein
MITQIELKDYSPYWIAGDRAAKASRVSKSDSSTFKSARVSKGDMLNIEQRRRRPHRGQHTEQIALAYAWAFAPKNHLFDWD